MDVKGGGKKNTQLEQQSSTLKKRLIGGKENEIEVKNIKELGLSSENILIIDKSKAKSDTPLQPPKKLNLSIVDGKVQTEGKTRTPIKDLVNHFASSEQLKKGDAKGNIENVRNALEAKQKKLDLLDNAPVRKWFYELFGGNVGEKKMEVIRQRRELRSLAHSVDSFQKFSSLLGKGELKEEDFENLEKKMDRAEFNSTLDETPIGAKKVFQVFQQDIKKVKEFIGNQKVIQEKSEKVFKETDTEELALKGVTDRDYEKLLKLGFGGRKKIQYLCRGLTEDLAPQDTLVDEIKDKEARETLKSKISQVRDRVDTIKVVIEDTTKKVNEETETKIKNANGFADSSTGTVTELKDKLSEHKKVLEETKQQCDPEEYGKLVEPTLQKLSTLNVGLKLLDKVATKSKEVVEKANKLDRNFFLNQLKKGGGSKSEDPVEGLIKELEAIENEDLKQLDDLPPGWKMNSATGIGDAHKILFTKMELKAEVQKEIRQENTNILSKTKEYVSNIGKEVSKTSEEQTFLGTVKGYLGWSENKIDTQIKSIDEEMEKLKTQVFPLDETEIKKTKMGFKTQQEEVNENLEKLESWKKSLTLLKEKQKETEGLTSDISSKLKTESVTVNELKNFKEQILKRKGSFSDIKDSGQKEVVSKLFEEQNKEIQTQIDEKVKGLTELKDTRLKETENLLNKSDVSKEDLEDSIKKLEEITVQVDGSVTEKVKNIRKVVNKKISESRKQYNFEALEKNLNTAKTKMSQVESMSGGDVSNLVGSLMEDYSFLTKNESKDENFKSYKQQYTDQLSNIWGSYNKSLTKLVEDISKEVNPPKTIPEKSTGWLDTFSNLGSTITDTVKSTVLGYVNDIFKPEYAEKRRNEIADCLRKLKAMKEVFAGNKEKLKELEEAEKSLKEVYKKIPRTKKE